MTAAFGAQVVLVVLAAATLLHPVLSSATFFLKFEHYENYHNVLKNHARCDSSVSSCDPYFDVTVSGTWGTWRDNSGCIMNSHELNFGNKIGNNLANPIEFKESSLSTVVTVDIRVKDCNLNSPDEDIGDFYLQLLDLPVPFIFTDRINYEDTDRIRTIDLPVTRNTPMSTKLRVSVWRQCSQGFYGRDCSKFCRAIPGHTCDPETGQLGCSGPACPPPGDLRPSSTRPRPPLSTSAATGIPVAGSPAAAAAAAGPTRFESDRTVATAGINWALFAALFAFLAVLALVSIGALLAIRRCQQPKRRRTRGPNLALIPPTHSMAVGLRDDSPSQRLAADAAYTQHSAQTAAVANQAYDDTLLLRQPHLQPPRAGAGPTQTEPATPDPDAYEYEEFDGRMREEAASGIYEEPDDLAARELPPPPPPPPLPPPPMQGPPRPPRQQQPSPTPSSAQQSSAEPQPPSPPPSLAPLSPSVASATAFALPQSHLPQPTGSPQNVVRTANSRSFSKASGGKK